MIGNNKRSQFGSRYLENENDVFKANAWDNVEWTKDIEDDISKKIENNSTEKLSEIVKDNHISNSNEYWDKFYQKHDNKFFKNRNWLTTEFPELICDNDMPKQVFEVGCGVGNTIFPLIDINKNANFYMFGCDFSKSGIDILKSHENYDEKFCKAFVADITDVNFQYPMEENSLDYITMIFVLSAISPEKMRQTISNLIKYLKPGGQILFRDYGKHDLAQMRFKSGHCLEDNFYLRGDGTLVYFFDKDELDQLFTGLDIQMKTVQLYVDRRLIVNRAKETKMYRVWLTARFEKC